MLKNFQRIKELFTPKNCQLSSQKYGFGIRDPRSGTRKIHIPDPGSRGQKGIGSWIRNTASERGGPSISLIRTFPRHLYMARTTTAVRMTARTTRMMMRKLRFIPSASTASTYSMLHPSYSQQYEHFKIVGNRCLSRIRILIFTHSGYRIPDPKTATKERGEKNLLSNLFCSHKFHNIENYFIF